MLGGFTFAQVLIFLAVFALAVVIAISFHECAHAFAALKSGDPSAKLAGRLTLNPVKHFEPVGLLCFVFAGIGWAKPVPVNPFNYRNFKRGNFWVSISGVLTNIVLAFAFSIGLYLVAKGTGTLDIIKAGKIPTPINFDRLWMFGLFWLFFWVVVINISLAIFNLLPIPPLDGYNMLVSFTKPHNRFMRFMRENAMIMLMVVVFTLLITGVLGIFRTALANLFLAFWGLFF